MNFYIDIYYVEKDLPYTFKEIQIRFTTLEMLSRPKFIGPGKASVAWGRVIIVQDQGLVYLQVLI